MLKEIFEAGEYFRFHFSSANNLELINPDNEGFNATVNMYVDLIGLRYKLDVEAR